MGQKTEIFSNRDLKNMILPLFLEQLLVMLVGGESEDRAVLVGCGSVREGNSQEKEGY